VLAIAVNSAITTEWLPVVFRSSFTAKRILAGEIIKSDDREGELGTKLQQENGNHMKTRTFKIDWLIPVLGIVLAGGGYFTVNAYRGFQEQIRSGEQFAATVDRLWEDVDLGRLLMQAQGSGCATTARSVDELLSARLATDSPRLASADSEARAMAERVGEVISRWRSNSLPMAGDLPGGRSGREVAGQGNLTQTLTSATHGQ
jgi:hypothetical protein